MNRAERRALARAAVQRGDATGHQTRVARTAFSKGMREYEKQQALAEEAERREQLGLVVATPRLWTPGDES